MLRASLCDALIDCTLYAIETEDVNEVVSYAFSRLPYATKIRANDTDEVRSMVVRIQTASAFADVSASSRKGLFCARWSPKGALPVDGFGPVHVYYPEEALAEWIRGVCVLLRSAEGGGLKTGLRPIKEDDTGIAPDNSLELCGPEEMDMQMLSWDLFLGPFCWDLLLSSEQP